jgi:tRNA threonylcarbamoyladenosine biosynthesis protein TsaB
MKILAFDTAMAACSAAVLADGTVLGHVFEARTRGHAEVLMARIDEVMAQAGLGFDALDRIAVTTGPGTFTGVRIGVAAARGMALALGIEAVGVTTLEVIAVGARTHAQAAGRPLAVAVDARRGEVYAQCFSAELEPLSDPVLLVPQAAADLALEHGCLAVGSAAALLSALPGAASLETAPHLPQQPDAVHLAHRAARVAAGGPPEPLYLRAPDAKLPAAP